MEKNNNKSFNHHDISLQLRSKEVSEVMGNIPSWVGIWGTFSIFLLFTLCVLFILNIHCAQRISGKATIMKQQAASTPKPVSQEYLLQVTVPMTEYNKIKAGQALSLFFNEENNYLDRANVGFLVDKITTYKDSCVLWLVGNDTILENAALYNSVLANRTANCQLVLDATVFEKVFGSLF
jgi:hypothetical protein